MAVTTQVNTRNRIKSIAEVASGLTSATIKLGIVDLSASSEVWKNITTTRYVVIGPAETVEFEPATGRTAFRVVTRIYFGFAADADYDLTAIEDVIFNFQDDLIDPANWSGYAPAPIGVRIGKPRLKRKVKPIVGMYEIELVFPSC